MRISRRFWTIASLAVLVFWMAPGASTAQAQVGGSVASWSGYTPSDAWRRYAPGSAWGNTAASPNNNVTQHRVYAVPPTGGVNGTSGWTGYAPGTTWSGYAPATAWSGYVTSRVWRGSPVYGTVAAPSRYHEYGSGRPVPLAKPWLPGSP